MAGPNLGVLWKTLVRFESRILAVLPPIAKRAYIAEPFRFGVIHHEAANPD